MSRIKLKHTLSTRLRKSSFKREAAILALLVLAYAAAELFLFRSLPVASDQMNYFTAAEAPTLTQPTPGPTRSGIIVPTAIAQMVFGFSEAAYYTVPLLTGAALLAASYVLTRAITKDQDYSMLIAIFAAICVGLNPIIIDYSTQLLTDVGATAFVTLGLALMILHDRQRSTSAQESWYLVGAGISFAIAFLFRESIILFAPAVIVVGLALHLRWRHLKNLWGLAIVVAGEALWSLAVWGNPLARLEAVLGRGSNRTEQQLAAGQALLQEQRDLTAAIKRFPELLIDQAGIQVGAILLVGFLLMALMVANSRFRMLRVLFVWIVGLWLGLLIVGAIDSGGGWPMMRLFIPRYWLPLLPPLTIGVVVSLYALATSMSEGRHGYQQPKYRVAPALLLAIVLAAFSANANLTGSGLVTAWEADRFREFRSWLSASPADMAVISDGRSSDILRMYTVGTFGAELWSGTIQGYGVSGDVPDPPEADALLILNKPAVWRAQRASSAQPADWTMNPPDYYATWRVSSDGALIAMINESPVRRVEWDEFKSDSGSSAVANEMKLEEGETIDIKPHQSLDRLLTEATVIDVQTRLSLSGSGSYDVYCSLNNRLVSSVTFTWFELPDGPVRSICIVPDDLTSPVNFAPVIRVKGPGTVVVESAWAQVVQQTAG